MMLSLDEQCALLGFYYRDFATDMELLSDVDLSGTSLSSEHLLLIHDLTGEPLFYDFDIVAPNGLRVGVVRSSACGSALPLLDAIMIGKMLFEPVEARRKAVEQALKDHPGATSTSPATFVCYGYPCIGVLVPLELQGKKMSAVYDAHACFHVRTWEGAYTPPEAGAPEAQCEGLPFYSYLEQLPEAGASASIEQQWRDAIRFFERFGPSTREARKEQRPAVSGTLLPVPLIGQETPYYCAVATAQMALKYLGYEGLTQEQIATAMETGPQGTYNEGMIKGYRELTHEHWTARLDLSPTFEEARAGLDLFTPAKTGIPRHARLLRGWRQYTYLDQATGKVAMQERFYIVNDPYPVKAGQLVLECVNKPINKYYRNLMFLAPVDR